VFPPLTIDSWFQQISFQSAYAMPQNSPVLEVLIILDGKLAAVIFYHSPTVIPQYCWWRGDTQLSVVWPRATTFDKITRVEGVLLRGQIRLITRGRATTYAIFENPTYTHTVSCRVPTFSGSKSSQKFVTPQCDLDRQNLHTVREWLN